MKPKLRGRFCRVNKTVLAVAVCLIVSACGAGIHCANPAVSEPAKTPVRDVRAVIVTVDETDRDAIKNNVEKAFDIFFEQTGIRLSIQDWKTIQWQSPSRGQLLQQLVDEMHGYEKPYDIAIGFYDMNPLERLGFNLAGGWMGAIDDVYRRFIVIRRDQLHVLVHELGHAFVFDHVHSGGVMTDFTLCFVGDHLCANSSVCFLEKDRREIVENKWRDFSTMPPLSERQDLIHGYAYSKPVFRLLYDLTLGRDREEEF
jgi:hypothetical protein